MKSGFIWDVVGTALAKIEETELVAEASLAAAELAAEEMFKPRKETLLVLSEAMDERVSVVFLRASLTIVLSFAWGQIYWFRTSQPLIRSDVNGL